MWRASENPWTSFNMIQRKAPFVCLLIPGTLNKKTPLLRCSCLIGWNKWSILMMSSISIAFWVMTCSVSKGACTTNLPPKYSFKSPITKRSCDNDHHKKCKTKAKDSTLPRWLLNLFFSLSKLAEAFPLQALMPRNMLEFMMGQNDMKSSVSEKISQANRSIGPMYQVIQTNVLHWIWCCSCCASFFTENKLVAARLLFQTEQVSCWKDCETAAMHVALCHSERCDSLKFAQHS